MEQKEAKTMMEILQSAIQMEIDGKEFYQRASQQSSTPSKQLFERLAIEEDEHRRKFEEIYEALKKRPDWPAVEAPSSGGKRLRSIFAEASKKLGTQINPSQSELDAIKQAMNMELKSYEFYRSRKGPLLWKDSSTSPWPQRNGDTTSRWSIPMNTLPTRPGGSP